MNFSYGVVNFGSRGSIIQLNDFGDLYRQIYLDISLLIL